MENSGSYHIAEHERKYYRKEEPRGRIKHGEGWQVKLEDYRGRCSSFSLL